MPESPLLRDVQTLRGVTPARLEQLHALGIRTLSDLLFHLPRAYEDTTDVRSITALVANQTQTVKGEVVEIGGRRSADGKPIVSIVISDDGKNCLEGVWFNQPYTARRFRYGQRVVFSGKPKWFLDHWQMSSPRVKSLDGADASPELAVVPIYPLTEDLRGDALRRLIGQALETAAGHVTEVLPPPLREQHRFPDVQQALREAHFPQTLAAAQLARKRFVYEEFFVLQVALGLRRRELRDRQQAPLLQITPQIDQRIRRLFPFRFTADQDQAVVEICRDLSNSRPMQRLLQADVGAGKTAVAIYAMLVAVACKHQAALMAPTEVLARQHWNTLEHALAKSRVRRLLLTGALTPKQRQQALVAIRQGEVDLVVGTQALVQEGVRFARLGVVVIDEQHKFGVNQRAQVRRLGVDPHYLVMTATPIPRTMALTVFGDLDVSTIRQLPPGRQPVRTRFVALSQRPQTYQRLVEPIRQGRQAYVVCPLVEESDTLAVASATQTHAELHGGVFQGLRLGLLHGRLDESDKDRIMQEFRSKQLDVLVATSVIEVGVDVPDATLMVIEHAEQFGLSQLHQLRGRVSRGPVAGECYLITDTENPEGRDRVRALVRTTDGFKLAEEDARQRGLGQMFGTKQHGLGELRFGDLIADAGLLQTARRDAFGIVAEDAGLRRPEHAVLRRCVYERYGKTLELVEVG